LLSFPLSFFRRYLYFFLSLFIFFIPRLSLVFQFFFPSLPFPSGTLWSNGWLLFLLRIHQVPVSNLGPEVSYPERYFRGFPQFLQKTTDNTYKIGQDPFPSSSFLNHTIRRYATKADDNASLNKPRTFFLPLFIYLFIYLLVYLLFVIRFLLYPLFMSSSYYVCGTQNISTVFVK